MSSLIHGCGAEIYADSKYCSNCGGGLDLEVKNYQITEFRPEIEKSILPYYPGIKIFTGYVAETRNYVRFSSGSNIRKSYWFVNIEDGNGQSKSINLNSENKFFDSIKVGDVITVCQPENIVLNGKFNKKLVSNSDFSGITLFYDSGKPRCYVDDCFEPEPFNPALSVLSFLTLFFTIWLSLGINVNSAIAGGLIGLVFGVFFFFRESRAYDKRSKKFNALMEFKNSLLEVPASALGFNKNKRENKDSDVLCLNCKSRNSQNFNFCINCCAPAEIDSEHTDNLDKYPTVSSQRRLLLNECNYHKSFEFKWKRFLLPSMQVKGNVIAKLYRVVDRDINVNVNSWTVKTTTETTHSYSSIGYSYKDEKVSYTDYRTSKMDGFLHVEDADGVIKKIEVPSAILRVTDVGDCILFAWTEVSSKKYYLHRDVEFVENLSKDLSCEGDKLADATHNITYVFYFFVAATFISVFLSIYFNEGVVGFSAWGLFLLFLIVMLSINAISNGKQLKYQSSPIWDLRKSFKQKRDSFIEKFEMFN